ncbi:MAG: GntR family transcriptional regulator [Anaerolineales bacterium]|nr:GntR family transcriptional regulator [Anaerolineales bacterium]
MSQTGTLYEQIAESIRVRIALGELAPGEQLPTVRELAQQWGCTTSTVSRAYALLAEEGLTSGQRGSGTRVAESPLHKTQPVLHWAKLLNQADRFILDAVTQGHSPAQIQTAVAMALARWQTLQQAAVPEPPAGLPPQQLRFVGSHDLSVELLAQRLQAQQTGLPLDFKYQGSLGGLMALARGTADFAGVHLYDQASDSYNRPFVERILPGRRVALVTLAYRDLGLILPPGNPLGMATIADLANPEVVWVNRQAGSGTRVWLDVQLRQNAIKPDSLQGYADEKSTHLQVAQAIESGAANAGLGIYAAAVAYGLDFVPLTQEIYQLVILADVWHTAACQAMLAILNTDEFKTSVHALGGYDTSATGELLWLEA